MNSIAVEKLEKTLGAERSIYQVDPAVGRTVTKILKDVRRNGDRALNKYTRQFDGANLTPGRIRVREADINRAFESVSVGFIPLLKQVAERVRSFYRKQGQRSYRVRTEDGTRLAMEGLAMTGAWVDREQGLVSVIALEMGGSSDLCARMKPGDPVVLMGPTGSPTEIHSGETVVLAGGGLGNAVLFSIGQALRARGSRVLYFAAYRTSADRYYEDNIESASDMVVWCSDEEPGFEAARPQDRSFIGNIVDAMAAYANGDLGPIGIGLNEADRIIAIGSDGMMNAVHQARSGVLKDYLKPGHVAIGSINSPMQCMMKEICAQCLQRHIDPKTGEETVVFSCFNQDQPLDKVDFGCLRDRLSQNSVQEKLTAQWIVRCLNELKTTNVQASSDVIADLGAGI